MHRFTVAFLAAFDAIVAATVGLAVALATLTVLWIFGLGGTADWGTLWPAAVAVWQLGNTVPLHISLPVEYLAATGIGEDQASFLLSLAPLAFAAFTAIFAARSGARASGADAWFTGVFVGSVVFAALTAGAAVTARTPVAAVHLWQAVLFPVLLFAIPATIGAVVTEWREAGAGFVARLRDRVEAASGGWGDAPGLVARGGAIALAGLVGAGALVVAAAVLLRGSDVVALFQASGVDLVGVIVFALGQLAYLPTLIIWGIAFVAGPGFQIGASTTVSPAGTQLGVIPGIPVLGLVPESTSIWLLLLALLPVALGAFAGWAVRSRIASAGHADHVSAEMVGPRVVIAAGIAVVAAGGSALLAWLASGSLGPGRLAEVGPDPGPVAFAVGVEVLIGASILLLSPRRESEPARTDPAGDGTRDVEAEAPLPAEVVFVEHALPGDLVEESAPRTPVVVSERFDGDAGAGAGIRPSVSLFAQADVSPDETEPVKKKSRGKKRPKPDADAPALSAPAPAPAPAEPSVGEPDAVTAPIDLPGTTER